MLELIMNKYEEILIGTMEQAESTNSRRQGSMRTRTRERAQRGDFLWRLRNEELAKKEKFYTGLFVFILFALLLFVLENKWLIAASVILYTLCIYQIAGAQNRPKTAFSSDEFYRRKRAYYKLGEFLQDELDICDFEQLAELRKLYEKKIEDLHYTTDSIISSIFVVLPLIASLIGYLQEPQIMEKNNKLSAFGIVFMMVLATELVYGIYYFVRTREKRNYIHRYQNMVEAIYFLEEQNP